MTPQQSERLITFLKNSPLVDGYSLSIHSSGRDAPPDAANHCLCGAAGIADLCAAICSSSPQEILEHALISGKPVFFRCPLGLYSFTVPVHAGSCLVCGGVRENLFNVYFHDSVQFAIMNEEHGVQPHDILGQLEKLPVTTEKKVRETMREVENLVHSFSSEGRRQVLESDSQMIRTIRNVADAIGREASFDKAIALFSETLGILFDIPAIAIFLREEESNCFHVETCPGGFPGPSFLSRESLPFHNNMYLPTILAGEEVAALFPEAGVNGALCLPLFDDGEFFGMAVLFDVSLTAHAIHLVEILADNLAVKLKDKSLRNEMNRKRRDVRLLEMIRALALTENQDNLLRQMMSMAAELADAASGSLMLVDDSGRSLHMAVSLGIPAALSRNIRTRLDEGIAGGVAASGSPLLVRDIERELQLGRKNRRRFVTKSCISLPLQFKGKTVGVLNLADKKSNAPFTSADQELLAGFVDQATVILVRTLSLGKAKRNSVIDITTGLYNQGFIQKRLREELSRSTRHNLPMSLVIVRPDEYAAGNDDAGFADDDWQVRDLARIVRMSLRDIDLVGRFGEKDFCILLPSTPLLESVTAIERINLALKNAFPGGPDEVKRDSFFASAGIASFPENGTSADELIAAAREALSQAEAEGGNRICCSANWPGMSN